MTSKGTRRWSEDGRAESTAGAWAAAAVVLALGALGFGVVSQVHVQDLERRIDSLERTTRTPSPTTGADPLGALTTPETTDVAAVPVVGPTEATLPASERAGVDAAYATVYDGSCPIEERMALIDDPTGIPDSLQKLRIGPLASAAAQLRTVVDRVTFTSSMTATVSYRLTSGAASGTEPERIGSARRVDGTWKVTRSTVCADLEDAGAPCSG